MSVIGPSLLSLYRQFNTLSASNRSGIVCGFFSISFMAGFERLEYSMFSKMRHKDTGEYRSRVANSSNKNGSSVMFARCLYLRNENFYELIFFKVSNLFTYSFNKLSAALSIWWWWFLVCFCHSFEWIALRTNGSMSGNFLRSSCSQWIVKPLKFVQNFRISLYTSVLITTIINLYLFRCDYSNSSVWIARSNLFTFISEKMERQLSWLGTVPT